MFVFLLSYYAVSGKSGSLDQNQSEVYQVTFNFFSIYLLVLLLGKYEGSVVFPINNVGILGFSALIGLLFFSEKFSVYKWFGLGFALGSIYLISNGG